MNLQRIDTVTKKTYSPAFKEKFNNRMCKVCSDEE